MTELSWIMDLKRETDVSLALPIPMKNGEYVASIHTERRRCLARPARMAVTWTASEKRCGTVTQLKLGPYWPRYLVALILSVLWNFTLNRKYTFHFNNNIPLAMLKVAAYSWR